MSCLAKRVTVNLCTPVMSSSCRIKENINEIWTSSVSCLSIGKEKLAFPRRKLSNFALLSRTPANIKKLEISASILSKSFSIELPDTRAGYPSQLYKVIKNEPKDGDHREVVRVEPAQLGFLERNTLQQQDDVFGVHKDKVYR